MAKVGEVLRFRDAGPSVEEARKKMIEAGEAPAGRPTVAVAEEPAVVPPTPATPAAAAVASVLEPEFEEEEVVVPPAAEPAPAAAAPVVTPPAAPPATVKPERVDTPQFTGEIKQEKGEWVAEIRYKNGSGTERFIAKSRNELMLKLLEGKGHATIRVNKAVRREKLGWSELDRQYPLPDGITAKDFSEMKEAQQDHLLATIASEQTLAFREAHPEFYKSESNGSKLLKFLSNERLPVTYRNLEYAFDELSDPNLPPEVRLEEAPVATPSLVQPAPAAPVQTDSEPAVATPPAAPAAVAAPAPAAAAAAPATPAVRVRPRGSSGLQPGQSSSPTEPVRPEAGSEPRELSEAELRKLPMSDLKRIADKDRRMRSGAQR